MPEAVLEKELALAASAMDCLMKDSQPAVDAAGNLCRVLIRGETAYKEAKERESYLALQMGNRLALDLSLNGKEGLRHGLLGVADST